jgi:hypothetical protein
MFDLINKIRANFAQRKCLKNRHVNGVHYVIEKTPISDWRDAFQENAQIRNIHLKCRCSACGVVFIKSNQWEFKVAESY